MVLVTIAGFLPSCFYATAGWLYQSFSSFSRASVQANDLNGELMFVNFSSVSAILVIPVARAFVLWIQ